MKEIDEKDKNKEILLLLVKVVGIMVSIVAELIVGIIVMFVVWHWRVEKQREERAEIVATYPTEIKKKLEEKYGKKFVVNPKFFAQLSGPLPFIRHYVPYQYEVEEEGEDGYLFNVWVYPVSTEDSHIKEIRDNYYWKVIEKVTKEYIEREMEGLLPQEYKIVFLPDFRTIFDDNIVSEHQIGSYFKSAKRKLSIMLFIIVPPNSEIEREGFTEDKVRTILNNFYIKNNRNMELYFCYCESKTDDDFEKLNVEKIEREKLKIFDSDSSNRDWLGEIDRKISIEIQ